MLDVTHPGTPPASIWFANVTSSDQVSYCHFFRPNTPHRTRPVWMPIRISTLTPVASRTSLNMSTMVRRRSLARLTWCRRSFSSPCGHNSTHDSVDWSVGHWRSSNNHLRFWFSYSHTPERRRRRDTRRFLDERLLRTCASWSNLPNSLFSICTNSGGVNFSDNGVKLTISA